MNRKKTFLESTTSSALIEPQNTKKYHALLSWPSDRRLGTSDVKSGTKAKLCLRLIII